MSNKLILKSLEDTKNLGIRLAYEIKKRRNNDPLIIFLSGDLGTGKTTLVKEIVQALGLRDPIKSPTFTIVEPYELSSSNLYHIDLYRINDPSELESIGLKEYLIEPRAIIFIEWPENSFGYLKRFDLKISLEHLSKTKRKYKLELNP